jgi:plastocyanin
MIRVFLVAAAAVALLPVANGSAAPSDNPKLFGTVGPGFTITLHDAQGARVTKLDPGMYDIEAKDLSDLHSFHLRGPGVDLPGDIDGTGTTTFTATFQDGTYVYFCDAHASSMRGTFVVGTPPPTVPSVPAGTITAKTKLVLTAGPGFKITLLTAKGKSFKAMKRGTYTVVVHDRSAQHDAHLTAPGFNLKTTIPFVGTRTWKVRLAKAGTLRFGCDAHPLSMHGSRKIV